MIQKIEQLVSIGKFRNHTASGDVAFRKLTIVYSDNGGGKTTLTSVFRSLTNNDPSLIQKRKSTGSTTSQVAHILERQPTGDTHHHFNGTTWSAPLPGIEIFDVHFVNENVYSGFEFNDEHRRHLHEFVIGAQGVAIQNQINQNKSDKTDSRLLQTELSNRILTAVGNGLLESMITAFLDTSPTEALGIDAKIARAEGALSHAQANAVIQNLAGLTVLSTISHRIDLILLAADLKTSSAVIQDQALNSLFENHCRDLSTNGLTTPASWLRLGYQYVSMKSAVAHNANPLMCPFCKQTISPSLDIIKTYTLKFDEAFNNLVARLQTHAVALQSFNVDSILVALNNSLTQNADRVVSWTLYIPSTVQAPNLDINQLVVDLRNATQALEAVIRTKQQNPTQPIFSSQDVDFTNAINTFNQSIDSYNVLVQQYNSAITSTRTQILPILQAQNELDEFKRTKLRFEPTVNSLCTRLSTERQRLNALEAVYPILVHQQEVAATVFFASYKDRVNHYLQVVFRTPFRIEDVVHIPPVGRANYNKLGYKLTIDGQDLSFDPSATNGVKESLSEGDRSTLALALFLAKLDIDLSLADKIIVFDDPLSSFDTNRRIDTVVLMQQLLAGISQIVVLSHNEFFLAELAKGVPASDKKYLRIAEDFVARAAYIEPLDLDALVENEYFKQIKELEDFRRLPDIIKRDHIVGLLRTILEAHLRFKFYRHFSVMPRDQQTLGKLIEALDAQGVAFRDNANRVDVLSKMRIIRAISCKPHHGEPMPTDGTLPFAPSSISVTQLDGLITDEFQLLDNRL